MAFDMEVVISGASWAVSLGMAYAIFTQGCIFLPLLLILANIAGWSMNRFLGFKLLSMVPITAAAALSLLAHTSIATAIAALFYGLYWSMVYRWFLWLAKIGYRKETSELLALYRKALYYGLGHIGHATTAPPTAVPAKPQPGQVTVVRTSKYGGERLAVLPPAALEVGIPGQGEVTIVLDPSVRHQTFAGFGGAFTESSAELLQRMGSANQERVVDAYFRSDVGLGYRIGRLHMNSCDFSRGNWSCCEEQDDMELKSFSIARYNEAILPMVRRAVAATGRPLVLFASPWSPPRWMKDTGNMLHGGKLLPKCCEAWARHFVEFARHLKEAGLPLFAFTVQNEPGATNGWENCLFDAQEERDFVRDHLGPAIEKSGMDLKIICWDHNRDDLFRRAHTIQKDPEAAKHVWGYGWHWYGDVRYDWWADPNDCSCFENVRRVRELCPDKHLWVTEVCQELGSHMGDWAVGERYADSIVRDFNNGCEAWVDWNLLLDQDGGPNHTGNHCSAPVIADPEKDLVFFQPCFFYIGHFSRHIQPGARRILSGASRASLEVTAFANPDGTIAVVVLNQTENGCLFCLTCGRRLVRYGVEPRSITTLVFLDEEADQAAAPEGQAAGGKDKEAAEDHEPSE